MDREAARWAAIGLLAHLAIVVALLVQHGDPEWFLNVGDRGAAVEEAREHLGDDVLTKPGLGYDGAYFWVLARDPLLLDADTTAAGLDRPVYRAQRPLYPAVAAPARLLGERTLLWALPFVNLVAVFGGGCATAALAKRFRAPPALALAFAFNPAVLMSTVADVADSLVLTLFVITLVLVVDGRRLAAVAGALTGLAKEPAMAGLGAAVLGPRRYRGAALWAAGTGAVAVVVWGLYVRWRLGWTDTDVREFRAVPFAGFVDTWRRAWRPEGDWSHAILAIATLVVAVWIALRWWHRRSLVLSAALPYALLVPLLDIDVLELYSHLARAFGPAVTLLALDVAAARRSTPSSGRPRGGDRRASRRSGSRSRPSPAGPAG